MLLGSADTAALARKHADLVITPDVFFFVKQKTAYEITEGDWSSDVCSSDLAGTQSHRSKGRFLGRRGCHGRASERERSEERRVGKEFLSCVDLGGRRIIKKKKRNNRIRRIVNVYKNNIRIFKVRD